MACLFNNNNNNNTKTSFVYLVQSNLNSTFKHFEFNNDEISIFGQRKHLIAGIEPRDFLNIFLRFWPLEPFFFIIFFLNLFIVGYLQ